MLIVILNYLMLMLNKVYFIAFVMACLNTFRHCYYFIQAFFNSNKEVPSKYVLTNKSLFLLGISISYIITVIFTGIAI